MLNIFDVLNDFRDLWKSIDKDDSGVVERREMCDKNEDFVFQQLAYGDFVFKVSFLIF